MVGFLSTEQNLRSIIPAPGQNIAECMELYTAGALTSAFVTALGNIRHSDGCKICLNAALQNKQLLKRNLKKKKYIPEDGNRLLLWASLPSSMLVCTAHSLERQESAASHSVNHPIHHIRFSPFFLISVIFVLCICTARPLSFQMASCLLHSGFHLEELLCICF